MRMLGDFILPEGTAWIDQKSMFGMTLTTDRFCDGSLFIAVNSVQGGKEITIEFTDPYCWLTPEQVDTLLNMARSATPYALVWDDDSTTVIFNHAKPSTFTQLYPVDPADFYVGTINLLEIT